MHQTQHIRDGVLGDLEYSKICVHNHSKKDQHISFQDKSSLNAGQKYCRMLQLLLKSLFCLFLSGRFTQGLLYINSKESLFYTGLTVYKFKRIAVKPSFPDHFKIIIKLYTFNRIGRNMYILKGQSAHLVINTLLV